MTNDPICSSCICPSFLFTNLSSFPTLLIILTVLRFKWNEPEQDGLAMHFKIAIKEEKAGKK
jgi:hypothetical protein